MIYNSTINFNETPNFTSKSKKDKPKVNEAEKTTCEILESDVFDEEDTFESTAKAMEKAERKRKLNVIGSALVALGIMSAPFVCANMLENDDFENGFVQTTRVFTEDETKLLEKADSLAKGGEKDNVLERKEFKQLLDYSPLDIMPRSSRESLKISSTLCYTPVNMDDCRSKEDILRQVKSSQSIINHLAEDYIKNPPKSSRQLYAEYVINNITPEEIIENVDFSELQHYQKDISVTKGLISFSTEKIRRNDADAEKKKTKAIENAQRLVDGIVHKYKMRAKVSGNYDGNDVLTKGELATLLDIQSLEGLPDEIAFRIIAKALEDYKPIDTSHATDERQVERTNEKVEESRQKVQEKLDQWAIKAQDYFFPMLHPNVIRVRNEIKG